MTPADENDIVVIWRIYIDVYAGSRETVYAVGSSLVIATYGVDSWWEKEKNSSPTFKVSKVPRSTLS